MIDAAQTRIEPQALEELPHDWPQQLADGLKSDYLVGYDAYLDEAHVWFSANQHDAVQVPLTALIDVILDDMTNDLIGFVVRQFAEIALTVSPRWERFVVQDDTSGGPRFSEDIPMTPIRQLSSNVPGEVIVRTLTRATQLIAA